MVSGCCRPNLSFIFIVIMTLMRAIITYVFWDIKFWGCTFVFCLNSKRFIIMKIIVTIIIISIYQISG